MQFYILRNSLYNFLTTKDSYVRMEKGKYKRDSIFVLIELNDVSYLAPLSSPKEKHQHMSERVDFIKISKRENLGVVNLNNMIPVKRSGITPLKFKTVRDEQYRRLLMKQYRYLKSREKELYDKAKYLRDLSFQVDVTRKEKQLLNRCVNFAKLEMLVKYY